MEANKKVIGIIGGMGPLATVDLFDKIVHMTKSDSDSGHIHIMIDNYPQIPDRSKAILNGGESPLPYIITSGMKLKQAGAELLLIPCHTSHYYYDLICESLEIPVINMIEETARSLVADNIGKVALLATSGVIKSGVYKKYFDKYGIESVETDESLQNEVMNLIYNGIKAGSESWDTSVWYREYEKLMRLGVESVVLGCTELPLAVKMYDIKGNFTDPTTILAKSAIVAAGYELK